MENLSNNHPSVDTLLAVMSEQMKTLLKSVDNIEKKLENKVDLTSFRELKDSFEEHKKDTQEKITGHTIKIALGTGILTALSWASHFLK
jgi:hypothetical protein